MTKGDLVAHIAAAADITKAAAQKALEALLEAITGSLKKGDNVTLTGFGTFRLSHRSARTGVNPRNPSEKIKIAASKTVTFKAGKGLKASVQ